MNGHNFQHTEALDVISNHFRKGRCLISALSDEETELANESYNEPLRSPLLKFISHSVELRNDVNKTSHEGNEDRSEDHQGIMKKDRNTMTRLQITRKRELPIQQCPARKRQHRRSMMLPPSFSDNTHSNAKSRASNRNSTELPSAKLSVDNLVNSWQT